MGGTGLKHPIMNRYVKYIGFFLAAASCAFGVCRGEMLSVLQKAAAICLECCGIG